tara:strand:+ start:151 stop:393 length:243 start_codon:yes stop_codon:yes gene_type:complete
MARTTVYGLFKPRLVGVKEIAQMLGVDRATVATWKHQSRLPRPDYKISGNPIWFEAEILFWVHNNDYIKARIKTLPELIQ